MTVTYEPSQVLYTGNGVATFFEFDIIEGAAIFVYVNSELTTLYSVQSNGINFNTAPADGVRIRIIRASDITQLRDWFPFGPFPADKTESAADKLIVLKGETMDYRRLMNLSTLRTIGDVTLVNDKGQDAVVPLWHHTEEEAGMFSGEVADQVPLEGSPTSTPESYVWLQCAVMPPIPPDEPTAVIVDSSIPQGQVMTEMNFSGLGNKPPIARSHPLGGNLDVRDFTAFFCFRWTDPEAGEIWDSEMFEFFAAKRPGQDQFYLGWRIFDAQDLPALRTIIQGNTVELGNLLTPGDQGEIGDWFVYMWSMKNIHVPDPDRFNAWLVNLTKGTETEYITDDPDPDIGDWNSALAGDFGHAINTARSLASRMGFMNNRSGDVTGSFGFSGTMGPHGFDFGQAMDFSLPSERRKICSLTELTDHGVGGVNIFGQQAAYYSQGDPQLNTGWINTGNPSVFNQASFGTGENLPPYDYPVTVHPMGDWEYDNMATAEASGDTWLEGQTIFIDEGNQVMVYRSSLVVDGHSGLIHLNPFFTDEDTYTAAVVNDSQPEGSDPSTWGWIDNSTGILNTDYAFDVSAGRARLRKLTAAGQARLDSTYSPVAADTVAFGIFDRCTAVNPDTQGGTNILLQNFNGEYAALSAYNNALVPTPPLNAWGVQYVDGSTYENILELWADETRFWFYVKGTRVAVWSDIGPLVNLEGPRTAGGGASEGLMIVGFPADGVLNELLVGKWLLGRLT